MFMKGTPMLRLIIIVLFLIVFFIVSLPLFLMEYIIGKFNPKARDYSSLAIVQWAFKAIIFLSGTDITFIGEENLPTDYSCLYIGNHRGFFDTVITYSHMKNLTGYISKKEIEKVPLLRVWMRYLKCLFLDRENIKAGLKTILTAIDYIKSGISIFIFPEGTRNKGQEPVLPFHEGSFKIATKANCPIVPVTINNSSAVLEDHFPFIKKAHVIVEYGKPIILDELDPEDKKHIATYVQNIIAETYIKNQTLV